MKIYLKFSASANDVGDICSISVEQVHSLDLANPFNIVNSDYSPKMGDKLYFLPGVNIPRIKLKDYALNYHIKTVRDVEEADVVFGGKLSNSKVISREWRTVVRTEDFKACFEELVKLDKLDDNIIERVKTSLEFYTEPIMFSDYNSINIITSDHLYRHLIINLGAVLASNKKNEYVNEVEEDYVDLVNFLDGKEILSEEVLLKNINGDDAVVINKDVYKQLEAMLDSSDTDNHVLAMEIMANCKLNDSLFYLLKLMGDHYNKLVNCRSVNHVNFKSLLSYLGIDKYRMNFKADDKIQKLMDKGVLTVGMLNAIIRDEISSTSAVYSNMVQIKTLTVNDKISEYLNKNYEYRLMEDFVPRPETPKVVPVQEVDKGPTWI